MAAAIGGSGGDARTCCFVGVGIDRYTDEAFGPLNALSGVDAVADLLADGRGFTTVVLRDVTDGEAEDQLKTALPPRSAAGGVLVMLWAGHGEPSIEGPLRLITRNASANDAPTRTAEWVAARAARTGAAQILLMFDTCFSGSSVIDAATVASRLMADLPEPKPAWVGVLTSAQAYERARDGVFAAEVGRVLANGPRSPELRLRFNGFNRGVRGDDVIDAVVQEWSCTSHQPAGLSIGRPGVVLPNPLYAPGAPERVAEHLIFAAQGRAPDEEGVFFTGRNEQLAEITSWMAEATPGVLVINGPAGSGKSALVGRIVSLSNSTERAQLLARSAVAHDPGEGSIHAHVHAHRLTLERVAVVIDEGLTHSGVLPAVAESRNHHELLGAMRRIDRLVTIAVDGLDEAGPEAWSIAEELLRGLGQMARVLVATREMTRGQGESLVATLATRPPIDLGDARWIVQTEADVRDYIVRRLSVVGATR